MKNRGFTRILLATDGTPQSEAAAHVAAALAEASGAAVRVVHCWSLEIHHRHGVWDVEIRAEAEKLLADAVDRLHALGLEADGRLMRSDGAHVGSAIAEAARAFGADLVIAGSRGLSDWRSLFEPLVSHQVLSAVDCPVLVIREDAASVLHEPSRVVVAIAGGADVAPAVRAAIAAAAAPGSKVLVTHVIQTVLGLQGAAYVEPNDEIQAMIAEAVAMLKDSGVTAESRVAGPGNVAHTIAQVAWDWQADIIVIGSGRSGDLASIVFGSVTHDLLRDTKRPLLVAERIAS
jgi:nucleotide-binding universal stress UspA family protein